MDFSTANSKLNPFQHGFRRGHSFQTQLLESIHEWAKYLNDGTSSHVVFTDFAKAFDKVPHQRLLLKLEHFGVTGNLLKWISAYLTCRRQRVVIDGCSSDWLPVTSGVPQGTILGPLLFLIYINDIGKDLSSNVRLFADDCVLYREISSLCDCTLLQHDINLLHKWTQKWHLVLSTTKCKVMNISLKKKSLSFTYTINNVALDWVDTFKYLGVKVHKKLNWGNHISETSSKASRLLNLLRRSMHNCSKDAKKRAYIALVRPHLEYCSPVWSSHQQKLINTLEKVQQRALPGGSVAPNGIPSTMAGQPPMPHSTVSSNGHLYSRGDPLPYAIKCTKLCIILIVLNLTNILFIRKFYVDFILIPYLFPPQELMYSDFHFSLMHHIYGMTYLQMLYNHPHFIPSNLN